MTFCAEGHHFLKAHIEHTVSRRAKDYSLFTNERIYHGNSVKMPS